MRSQKSRWVVVIVMMVGGAFTPWALGSGWYYWYGSAQQPDGTSGDGVRWDNASNWSVDDITGLHTVPNANTFAYFGDDAPAGTQAITVPANTIVGGIYVNTTKYDLVFNGGSLNLRNRAPNDNLLAPNFAFSDNASKNITFNCDFTVDNSTGDNTSFMIFAAAASKDNGTITFNGSINIPLQPANAGNCYFAIKNYQDNTSTLPLINGDIQWVFNHANNVPYFYTGSTGETLINDPLAVGPVTGQLRWYLYGHLGLNCDIRVNRLYGYQASPPTEAAYLHNRGTAAHSITVDNFAAQRYAGDNITIEPNPDGGTDNLTISIKPTVGSSSNTVGWKTLAGTTILVGSGISAGTVTLGDGTNGVISGTGKLVVANAYDNGVVEIWHHDNYTGGTFVNKGILRTRLDNATPIGGDLYLAGGTTFRTFVSASNNQTIGNLIGGDGAKPAILEMHTGTLTINGGILPGGAAGTFGALVDNFTTSAGFLVLGPSSNSVFDVQEPVLAQDNLTSIYDNITLGGNLTVNVSPLITSGTYTLITSKGINGSFNNVTFINLPADWTGAYLGIGDNNTTVKVRITSILPQVANPVLTPAPGTYNAPQTVSMTCSTNGAVIHYTTDGTMPNISSPVYSVPIAVNSTVTIYAIALADGYAASGRAGGSYNIVVATPVLTPAPGTYNVPQTLSMTCSTTGAVIRYTTDGTTPNSSSPVYSTPIAVNSTVTIYAKAFADGGYDPSATAGGVYTIATATPVITPPGGYYVGSSNLPPPITISCATSGATIWYTTDNTTPTQGTGTSIQYNGSPVMIWAWVETTYVVKAIAYSSYGASAVAIATYKEVDYYDNPAAVLPGKATVDGNLAEWDNASFVSMATLYAGTNTDIDNASYAAKWDPATSKVYIAVKVKDNNHYLTDTLTTGNHDAVELYIHTPGSTGPLNYYTYQDFAQQYVVGITTSGNGIWDYLGPTAVVPPANTITAAGKMIGEWLCYEAMITPYDYFGGISGQASILSVLHAGDTLGLDAIAVTGAPGVTSGYLCENGKGGKYNNWLQFGLHQLVTQTFTATDLAALLAALDRRSPDPAYVAKYDFDGDYEITSSDLAYLLANMQ